MTPPRLRETKVEKFLTNRLIARIMNFDDEKLDWITTGVIAVIVIGSVIIYFYATKSGV